MFIEILLFSVLLVFLIWMVGEVQYSFGLTIRSANFSVCFLLSTAKLCLYLTHCHTMIPTCWLLGNMAFWMGCIFISVCSGLWMLWGRKHSYCSLFSAACSIENLWFNYHYALSSDQFYVLNNRKLDFILSFQLNLDNCCFYVCLCWGIYLHSVSSLGNFSMWVDLGQ